MAKRQDLDVLSEALHYDVDSRLGSSRRKCMGAGLLLGIVLVIISFALAVIITLFHVQAVQILQPFSDIIRDLPAGFLILGAIAFVASFPPFFGHEIIAVLCGAAYGLWVGFAIMAVSTILGEVGTWLLFQRSFKRRSLTLECTSLKYGSLTRIVREGGFLLVLFTRLSAIPPHFSTAFLSTCNIRFWQFTLTAALTLPKQLALVYLGSLPVSFGVVKHGNQGSRRLTADITVDRSLIIQVAVLGTAVLVTLGLGLYVGIRTRRLRAILAEEQHRRKLLMAVGTRGRRLGSRDQSMASVWSGPAWWAHTGETTTRGTSTRGNSSTRNGGVIGLGAYNGDAPSSDHASLISGIKLQQDYFADDQDQEQHTRGRTRTRKIRGRASLPPVQAVVADKQSDSKQRSSLGRSKSDRRSKGDFYMLGHEMSILRRDKGAKQAKDDEPVRNYNYVLPPPVPYSALHLPPLPPLPPPPPTPPLVASSSVSRPTSSSQSAASFSRPRRPQSRRTLSVGSSVHAGHAYHNRFQSEDATNYNSPLSLSSSAAGIGTAVSGLVSPGDGEQDGRGEAEGGQGRAEGVGVAVGEPVRTSTGTSTSMPVLSVGREEQRHKRQVS